MGRPLGAGGFGNGAVELRETDEFIGRVGLHEREGWPGLEVGWLFDRRYWGRGLATEGGRASLRFAWDAVGADHVISLIRPENVASVRVAEKLGGRGEGETLLAGFRHHVYGIDRPR